MCWPPCMLWWQKETNDSAGHDKSCKLDVHVAARLQTDDGLEDTDRAAATALCGVRGTQHR